ncbi:hypothetical protein ACSBR2_020265 [Camellia fascicularis]
MDRIPNFLLHRIFVSTTASSTLTLSSMNNTNGNKSKNVVASSTSLRQKTLSPISELKELASSLLDSAKRHSIACIRRSSRTESGEMCAMKEVTLFSNNAKSKESAKQLGQVSLVVINLIEVLCRIRLLVFHQKLVLY